MADKNSSSYPGLTRNFPEPRQKRDDKQDAKLTEKLEQLERENASLRENIERLNASERFLNSLIENIPNMIFVKDARELRFVRFNRAGELLLGYPRQALMGKNDFDFFPKEEAEFFIEKDRAVLRGKSVVDIPEETLQTSMKEKRFLHTRKISILDENGEPEYLLGISEDITDRKRAEAERDQSREIANQLDEQRQQRENFVAALSHDLRGPLTAAKTSAEMIARNIDPQKNLQHAQRIAQSIDRADRMIRDLLDANRIRAGEKISLDLSEARLEDILLEACEEIRCVHGGKLLLEYEAEPIHGVWSAEELRRAFENLITNAVKYGDPSKPISVSARREGESAHVSVHNWGNPIDPSEVQLLFRPFGRTKSAKKSGKRGWGLGLTLVRGVMEAHGGSVSVTSSLEAGTTFSLRFPITAHPSRT